MNEQFPQRNTRVASSNESVDLSNVLQNWRRAHPSASESPARLETPVVAGLRTPNAQHAQATRARA